jgi:ATP-binding cassette, subfamily F, member 3
MIVQIVKGTKAFGSQTVFENIDFDIRDGQKFALVGRNGSGKTTLMHILDQTLTLDHGEFIRPKDLRVGTLDQMTFADESITVEAMLMELARDLLSMERQLHDLTLRMQTDHSQETLDAYASLEHRYDELGGYTYRYEHMTVVTKLGFTDNDLKKALNAFSSGQKTRLAFIKLLLSKPDLLLLDEPTNHLDLATVEWLEGYLKHYEKAILFVSHDRMFIDRIAQTIYELEFGTLTRYPGNYTQYVAQKALNQEKQLSAYKRQQKDIERLEELIEKFRYKKSKAKFAQSKIKYLDRMDRVDKPTSDQKNFKPTFSSRLRGGKEVLRLEDLRIGYDAPLAQVSLTLRHGQRLAVLGPNGQGKSTLLKTIVGRLPALGGDMLVGHQIEIGYFDQELETAKGTQTVLEALWDAYPELTHTQVRTVLGSFLFTSDEVFKSVNVLSGGEKVRLSLAKLMLQRANLLILDEPTNHLDILGKEALETALADYDGTLIFVSHDRYFIQKMANAVLEIDQGQAVYSDLGYAQFTENKVIAESGSSDNKKSEQDPPRESVGRLRKQLAKLEEAITEKETQLAQHRELRYDPHYYHDHTHMRQLDEQIDTIHNELSALMADWEALSAKIAEYTA